MADGSGSSSPHGKGSKFHFTFPKSKRRNMIREIDRPPAGGISWFEDKLGRRAPDARGAEEGKVYNNLHWVNTGSRRSTSCTSAASTRTCPSPTSSCSESSIFRRRTAAGAAGDQSDPRCRHPRSWFSPPRRREDVLKTYQPARQCYVHQARGSGAVHQSREIDDNFWLTVVTLPNGK